MLAMVFYKIINSQTAERKEELAWPAWALAKLGLDE